MAEKPPTFKYHIWQIGLLVLIAGAIGWSAFVKPTTVNKAESIIQNFDKPTTPIAGLSCWRIRANLLYEHGTPSEKKK